MHDDVQQRCKATGSVARAEPKPEPASLRSEPGALPQLRDLRQRPRPRRPRRARRPRSCAASSLLRCSSRASRPAWRRQMAPPRAARGGAEVDGGAHDPRARGVVDDAVAQVRLAGVEQPAKALRPPGTAARRAHDLRGVEDAAVGGAEEVVRAEDLDAVTHAAGLGGDGGAAALERGREEVDEGEDGAHAVRGDAVPALGLNEVAPDAVGAVRLGTLQYPSW